MSDTWDQLQAHKRKHESLKERLAKRRKERQANLDVKPSTSSENPPDKPDSSTSTIDAVKPNIKEELKSDERVEDKTKIKGFFLCFSGTK